MQGQWLGWYAGDLSGQMTLEVDQRRQFQDVACYFHIQGDPRILYFRCQFPTGDKASIRAMVTTLMGYPVVETNVVPIEMEFRVQEPELVVEFHLETGERCGAMLLRSKAASDSELPAKQMTWAQFESRVRKLEPRRYIFRGQENNSWRLRTSFHRSGRSNMLRYLNDDVSMMHRLVTSLVPDLVDIQDRIRYASFLALAQHHGYPTPLLDWSASPFVAAFFAFRKAQPQRTRNGRRQFARIFILDEDAWNSTGDRLPDIAPRLPHMSLIYPHALANPRLIPQQALTAVTNIDDIESYIQMRTAQTGVEYLSAIDIRITERAEALKQLAFMGVTAGSLFPGLDGAFEELRTIRF